MVIQNSRQRIKIMSVCCALTQVRLPPASVPKALPTFLVVRKSEIATGFCRLYMHRNPHA